MCAEIWMLVPTKDSEHFGDRDSQAVIQLMLAQPSCRILNLQNSTKNYKDLHNVFSEENYMQHQSVWLMTL